MAAVGRSPQSGPATAGQASEAAALLSLEEAMCPLCLDVLVRPVTMPCQHSMCLLCFQRTVQLASLCCPLCRTRISNWARQHSREKALVDWELWEKVRRSFPERCSRRMQEEEEEGGSQGSQEDFIFRAPIQVSKPGELREEYESQLRKKLKEQTQEEMASEELDSSYEQMEDGKRKQEERLKGESRAVKVIQSKFCDHPDDSENEEPFRGRTVHRSAFVSKCSNYSLASLSGQANSREERSRSCSDAVKERSKSRQKASHRPKAKISKVSIVSVAGVLSSTENNRSFSAPDLTSDKRLSGSFSYPLLQKSERSISPESNDSISEELNHFKPIVCSPCTPPKRLPNGKVLRPVIIKSTPRNLRRSLQSPTCYKASPRILMKWNAIFQDRRAKTTLSQGTITVIGDALTASDHSHKRPAVSTPAALTTKERSQNVTTNIQVSPLPNNDCLEPAIFKDHAFLLPDAVSHKPSKSKRTDTDANTEPDCKLACRRCPLSNRLIAESQTQTVSFAKTKGKRQHRHQNNSQRINIENGTCCVRTEVTPPSQRRGQKRHCKTKHLDNKSSSKRLKTSKQSDLAVEDQFCKERQEKHWQEEEDRKLAFRLQRVLNNEINTIDRRKGSRGEYLLRSNSTAHTST